MVKMECMSALLDEFLKISAATGRFRISQTRSGKRPMSVMTLLRKEKDGSLYKDMKVAEDRLPGGLADKIPKSSFDPKAVAQGKKVELEHTRDEELAAEIARDHIAEDPRYYEKLKKMEKGASDFAAPHLFGSSGAMQLGGHVAPEVEKERVAQAKRRPGDAPSLDEVPAYPASSVANPSLRAQDLAVKVSGLGHLVARKLRYPTRPDDGEAAYPTLSLVSFQGAAQDAPSELWNPDWSAR